MDFILLIVLLVNIFVNIFLIKSYSFDVKTRLNTSQSTPDESVTQHLTTYELQRLEREEEFDQRINRLKEEVALQQNIIKRGTVADELHPLVHNLPHDAIDTRRNALPDVEVSE